MSSENTQRSPHKEAFFLNEEGLQLTARIEKRLQDVFKPEETRRVGRALSLAGELHGDQEPRDDNTPSINHILRVTARVLDAFGVTDPDIVIAALLHDSIEDQRGKLAARWRGKRDGEKTDAFNYLASQFGARPAVLVGALTKPDKGDLSTRAERDQRYFEKLKAVIADPDILFIKLADFYDNVLSLEHAGTTEHQKKRAKKYLPVFALFIARLQEKDVGFPASEEFPDGKLSLIAELYKAKEILERILLQ